MTMTQPDSLVKRALEFFFRTSFKRVLSSMIVLGVGLLGLAWPDIAALVLETVGHPEESGTFVTFAQFTGFGMIATGFAGHLVLFLIEKRGERRAEKATEHAAAAKLVAEVRVLIRGFREPLIPRDAGYYNQQIAECQKAATAFRRIGRQELLADPVLAGIANPKFDASKTKPYFDLELDDLEALVRRIEAFYELE